MSFIESLLNVLPLLLSLFVNLATLHHGYKLAELQSTSKIAEYRATSAIDDRRNAVRDFLHEYIAFSNLPPLAELDVSGSNPGEPFSRLQTSYLYLSVFVSQETADKLEQVMHLLLKIRQAKSRAAASCRKNSELSFDRLLASDPEYQYSSQALGTAAKSAIQMLRKELQPARPQPISPGESSNLSIL